MASWRHTEELKIGDIVLYPISKDSKNVDKITFENKKLPFDYNSKSIPKNIFMDGKFLRLSGYYIAEGYLRDKVTKTYLSFTFGLNEDQFVDDVIAIIRDKFGIEARKKFVPEKNTIIIDVNSVMIVRLFKDLFDTGAENKHIPQFMMTLHPQKQKELIKGLWRGDGYFSVNRKWPRAGYSTISYELCQQLKLLLLRQGIIPSIYIEKEKVVNGVKHEVSYRIHIGNRDSMKKLSKILGIIYHNEKDIRNDVWIDKNYVYVPVTHISKMFYNGFVFNLEVDDAKSFTSDSLLLHNCGDVMYLYIKVKNDKITNIKFETFGCAAAIATSSAVTDIAKGRTLEEALKINKEDVAKAVDGLPPIKMHCSLLAIDALKAAIDDYRKKKK
jgi:nitrogen fixation NifU-like protein